MKIALISFEFPPETAYGGIASYVHEIALMLTGEGHLVEVFCAGSTAKQTRLADNLIVNTVADLDKDSFAESLLPVFTARDREVRFDVAESPEIYGDARAVRRQFPGLPLVVKLHTPSFLCHRLNDVQLSFSGKMRFALGSLRQGRWSWPTPNLDVLNQRNRVESALYHAADVVVSPSRDLIRLVEAEWGARPDGISVLVNPYSPSRHLLEMPPSAPATPLLYLGRLEMRKGVPELVEALALLEKRHHPAATRFVGYAFPSPKRNLRMDAWAARRLPMDSGRYTFTGPLPREAAIAEIAHCGLVALPSRWENFPYTCLESMAAGRVVIGSRAGGMADMITDGVDGFLVPPGQPRRLAAKIQETLSSPEKFADMGRKARQRVLSTYSYAAILPQQIQAYQKAIDINPGRRLITR